MKWLLVLLLLPIAAYYGVVAFFPAWLDLPCGPLPLSLPLALGLIWLGFIVTLLYVRQASRREGRP
ncbi:MAG: DUF485 domain-containing protein [Paludibacterium sp.]|uniref:DUF485 domain-containing protein n=1 Tax=Paludibacterium sp. TaxID=1917523 RepID=UPI0025D69268|nr:DUF485 domain-containing protein [Paludibacterium sp.]MBV8046459.1 DUF485 domain-containing protein [Paludibacterium sp.]MBV8646174.1 DUF485 domain-containing protein [Paludibacterium sp.]